MTEADDDVPCYWHPRVLTALACVACERPICVDCATAAPVGFKCPDCARVSRRAAGKVPTTRLAAAAAAACVLALVGAVLVAAVLSGVAFIGLILAWFVGMGMGEVVRRVGGGYRDVALARWAVVAAAGAYLIPVAAQLVSTGGDVRASAAIGVAFDLLAAIVAAVAAYRQAQS